MASTNRQRRPSSSATVDVPRELRDLANVGPATLRDFETLSIRTVGQLARQEPFALYRKLCRLTGARHDPCVIDVFIAAINQAQGHPARAWWKFTPMRKARLAEDASLASVRLPASKPARKP